MAIRISVEGAEKTAGQIDRLRRAYTRLKGFGDDRGFDFFASLHGLSLPQWCEHGTLLFLPWHRAYLYYYELALQSRLGQRLTVVQPQVAEFADLGLPWWDWLSAEAHANGFPASYAQADTGGQPNVLAGSQIGACGDSRQFMTGIWSPDLVALVRRQAPGAISPSGPPTTLRKPDPPAELPTQKTLDDHVLNEKTFAGFSRALEQVHGQVHVWCGGTMAVVPTAAYDPIFWSHHAMIDRLWYVWQLGANGEDPPADLMNTVLAPFPMTVADTLNIANLRYGYAVQTVG